ncbi:STAS domain-containing protein [Fodinicola feengrottensis]|uniref:STAS domain-containing protein n=2 Tax=Fodinicola feengrottensis TaxID=435914 RepID=A0ABN2IEE1_9ACTN|nr:STAS domain-containing protein [Fodinicola feengrottensis]
MSSLLRTKQRTDGLATTVLGVIGEIDMTTAGDLGTAIAAALVEQPGRLILDLSAVTFLASAGLNVLVTANNEAAMPVGIVASGPAVVRALEVTGLDGVLAVYSTLAEALSSTRESAPPER